MVLFRITRLRAITKKKVLNNENTAIHLPFFLAWHNEELFRLNRSSSFLLSNSNVTVYENECVIGGSEGYFGL